MSTPKPAATGEPARSAVDYLSEAVGHHFKVHHIEGDRYRLAFFTRETTDGAKVVSDSEAVDRSFDGLRTEVKGEGYVPTLQLAGDDGVITVSRVVDPQFRSSRVNLMFLILTLISVQSAGALLWAAYITPHGPTGREVGVDWLGGEAQAGGFLFFALPLLAVLGLHEMGHFFTARHYHVRASLPFFIPSLPPLGTFGAFISMRDPLPSRKVIFDIGLSGPFVGFLASIAVTVVGAFLMLASPSPARPEVGGSLNLGSPLMFDWILRVIGSPENSYLHPTLFAGWAGFLVTAFNLIPAAQLDGGHVFFSLIRNGPNRESQAVAISIASVLGIAVLGSLLGYNGWLLLLVIVFLTIRHPPPLNQISSLGWKRLGAGVGALAIFAVSFSPAPIYIVPADYSFEAEPPLELALVPAGGFANVSITLENKGNAFNELTVELYGQNGPYTAGFSGNRTKATVLTNNLEFVRVKVNVTVYALTRDEAIAGALNFAVRPVGDPALVKAVVVYALSVRPHPTLNATADSPVQAAAGTVAHVPVHIANAGDVPLNLTWNVIQVYQNWSWGFGELGVLNGSTVLNPDENTTVDFVVHVINGTAAGTNATYRIDVDDATWPGVQRTVPIAINVTS